MKLTLSENIRSFRKERKMTQEQLATVLGVTVGAVYKWESGLSVPELDLIVEMADFFDTSVDVFYFLVFKFTCKKIVILSILMYLIYDRGINITL